MAFLNRLGTQRFLPTRMLTRRGAGSAGQTDVNAPWTEFESSTLLRLELYDA